MATSTTQVADVIADLEAFVEQTVKTIAVEATANLQEVTPVDTGYARASWVPSVGQPASDLGGTAEAPSPAAAAQGMAQILGYRLSDGSAFVTNNVEYIRALDRGHSKQAPAGFVRVAVEQAVGDAMKLVDGLAARLRSRGEE